MPAPKGNSNRKNSIKHKSKCTYRSVIISYESDRDAWNYQSCKANLSFSKWARQKLNNSGDCPICGDG